MTIRIFNPEHDIALASNMERFTAPHAGRQLRSDLCYLPALWSNDGDVVIVDDIDFAESAYRKLKAERKPVVEFCTMEQIAHVLSSCVPSAIDPWGWDLAIRFQVLSAGVPEYCLPSKEAVQEIRFALVLKVILVVKAFILLIIIFFLNIYKMERTWWSRLLGVLAEEGCAIS